MKFKKKYIFYILIAAGIGFGIYFWFFKEKTVNVTEVKAQNVKVLKTVSADGIVKSRTSADLAFSASGKIERIYFKEGDFVKSGETLAKLNSNTQSLNAKSSKDLRDIAIRDKELFIDKYKDSSDIDEFGREQYDLTLRKYNEQISRAESDYRAMLSSIGNLYIKAPSDGTIVNITKNEGENATASEIIVSLVDINNLYFEILLEQEDFGSVKLGQIAEINMDAYENQPVAGSVLELPQTVQTNNNAFKVVLDINRDGPNILYGMTGDARITVEETAENTQSLTFDQIFIDEDDSHYIWILDKENKLIKRKIQIGLEGDIYTEIKDDLSNLKIVIPGEDATDDLSEGTKANIVT